MATNNIKYDINKIEEAKEHLEDLKGLMEGLKDIEDLVNQKTHYLDKLNDDLFDVIDDKEELFSKIENIIKLVVVMQTAEEMDIDIKNMISKS